MTDMPKRIWAGYHWGYSMWSEDSMWSTDKNALDDVLPREHYTNTDWLREQIEGMMENELDTVMGPKSLMVHNAALYDVLKLLGEIE